MKARRLSVLRAACSREIEGCVEHGVEVLHDVFREESQDHESVLLEKTVLAAVTTPGVGILEVLRPVELDRDSQFFAHEIDLHPAPERALRRLVAFGTVRARTRD